MQLTHSRQINPSRNGTDTGGEVWMRYCDAVFEVEYRSSGCVYSGDMGRSCGGKEHTRRSS
jgi:hypothetical protein